MAWLNGFQNQYGCGKFADLWLHLVFLEAGSITLEPKRDVFLPVRRKAYAEVSAMCRVQEDGSSAGRLARRTFPTPVADHARVSMPDVKELHANKARGPAKRQKARDRRTEPVIKTLRRLARVPHYCSIKVTQTKNTIGRETGDSDRS
jgi:hypothetical protein